MSGAVTAYLSWRAVFVGAALVMVAFAALAARALPAFPPTVHASYAALLRSMATPLRDVTPLRRAAMTQALLSLAFSGFWSTLALGLAAPPFGLGSVVAGSFGIAGAAGALAVLVVGTIVFDLGVQSCLIAHQTIVYAQDPTARSRLNAALVSAMFIGMSCGAFLANRIFERSGFAGVCVMGAIAAGGALVMRALTSEAR